MVGWKAKPGGRERMLDVDKRRARHIIKLSGVVLDPNVRTIA